MHRPRIAGDIRSPAKTQNVDANKTIKLPSIFICEFNHLKKLKKDKEMHGN